MNPTNKKRKMKMSKKCIKLHNRAFTFFFFCDSKLGGSSNMRGNALLCRWHRWAQRKVVQRWFYLTRDRVGRAVGGEYVSIKDKKRRKATAPYSAARFAYIWNEPAKISQNATLLRNSCYHVGEKRKATIRKSVFCETLAGAY